MRFTFTIDIDCCGCENTGDPNDSDTLCHEFYVEADNRIAEFLEDLTTELEDSPKKFVRTHADRNTD